MLSDEQFASVHKVLGKIDLDLDKCLETPDKLKGGDSIRFLPLDQFWPSSAQSTPKEVESVAKAVRKTKVPSDAQTQARIRRVLQDTVRGRGFFDLHRDEEAAFQEMVARLDAVRESSDLW